MLQREWRYSKAAQKSTIFSGAVVEAQRLAPMIIRYPKISTKGTISEKVGAMLLFSSQRVAHLEASPKETAVSVLQNYCAALCLDWQEFMTTTKLDGGRLEFHLPVSFMHGDFGPSNVGLQSGQVALFDWEFAYEKGSLLYDWWYLNHILNYKNLSGDYVVKAGRFFQDAVRCLALTEEQVRYFCELVNKAQTCVKA